MGFVNINTISCYQLLIWFPFLGLLPPDLLLFVVLCKCFLASLGFFIFLSWLYYFRVFFFLTWKFMRKITEQKVFSSLMAPYEAMHWMRKFRDDMLDSWATRSVFKSIFLSYCFKRKLWKYILTGFPRTTGF